MDQSLANLGPKLKALRQERGLTLQEVSDRCGVAVSTLSKIENGHVSGTVSTMLKIARGLGVLFDELLEHESEAPPPTARLVRTNAGEVDRFPTEFYDYDVHSSALVGRHMLPLVIAVKTRQPPPRVDWSTHEGEEFLLVLEGRIELHTEHYAPITLEPGDSVYFDSLMRHAYVSVGDGDARVASVSLARESGLNRQMERLQRSSTDGSKTSSGEAAEDEYDPSADTPAFQSSNPTRGRT